MTSLLSKVQSVSWQNGRFSEKKSNERSGFFGRPYAASFFENRGFFCNASRTCKIRSSLLESEDHSDRSSVHFIGIGGTGMSALAFYAKRQAIYALNPM